jgi:hypothetical protein
MTKWQLQSADNGISIALAPSTPRRRQSGHAKAKKCGSPTRVLIQQQYICTNGLYCGFDAIAQSISI